MSEAAEADGCLSVLLMRPSGPLEREEEDETGGGQDGEKESTAQRVFLFSFKAEHWEAGEAGEMFRGCRSSERLSS